MQKRKVEGYIYRDGFVYYTPKFFDYNSIDPQKILQQVISIDKFMLKIH